MNLRISNEAAGASPLDDSLSGDTRDTAESPSYAFAEVVTLKYPHRYTNTLTQITGSTKTFQFLIISTI